MKTAKRAQLEAHGWTVGDTQAFLGLNDEEQALIDLKLALAERRSLIDPQTRR